MAESLQWWKGSIKKSKAIYYTMNMLRCGEDSLLGDCWIPDRDIPAVIRVFEKKSVCLFQSSLSQLF